MHILQLLGVSCGGQSLLMWLGPYTFAYLNKATQVNLAQYDVHSHTDLATYRRTRYCAPEMGIIQKPCNFYCGNRVAGPFSKIDMEKKSDICKSYGLPHLFSPGACWTNALISLCEIWTVFTHLQKEFPEANLEQIWTHLHKVAKSLEDHPS